jgi:hypothetical protein
MNKQVVSIPSQSKLTGIINKGLGVINSDVGEYIDLLSQTYKTISNIDKIPKNEALKGALKSMLNSEKISSSTLDDITMLMQVVNTLNKSTLMSVLLAFEYDDKTSSEISSFLDELKARENYIQRGGEDGDEVIPYTPGQTTTKRSNIPNIILLLFGLLASVLFACQGIMAVETSISGGIENMVQGLQTISDKTPVSPFSEEIISTLHESGQSGIYETIMNQISPEPIDSGVAQIEDGKPEILALPAPPQEGKSDTALTAKSAIDTSIQSLEDYTLPTLTTGDRLGLLVGKVPTEYVGKVTKSLTGIIARDVTPVFTRIMVNAAEAGAARAWNSGASGNMFVQAANTIGKFMGYGSSLPIGDQTIAKGLDTFKRTITRSLTEISDLAYETTHDMTDNVVNNVYGYGAFAMASIAFSVMQATIIGLRIAKTDAQRNGILAVSSRLLNGLNTPFLALLMGTQKGLGMVAGYIAGVSMKPPGTTLSQYGGKKRKTSKRKKTMRKLKDKSKHGKSRKIKGGKKVRSILKRVSSKKRNLKKGTKRVKFVMKKKHTRKHKR